MGIYRARAPALLDDTDFARFRGLRWKMPV
jgi:hypothetical protein